MAKYIGFMPVVGTLGNLTFYKGDQGELHVKPKSGLDKSKVMNDPAFERTRENMSEFGKAGKAAQFLLQTFREAVLHKPDRYIMGRLLKAFMEIIHSDMTHAHGRRTVHAGDLNLLRGFEFNKKSNLEGVFWGNFTGAIDRSTGLCRIEIPSYNPCELIQMPESATHYRFVAAAIGLDFTDNTFVRHTSTSDYLPWNSCKTMAFTLNCDVQPNSAMPLFLSLGVEYAKNCNGKNYPLHSGRFNAMSIIKTDA